MTHTIELDQLQRSQEDAIAPSIIHTDELTEGDIIRHFTGDTWMVMNEPEYKFAGIEFEVMWLDVDTPDKTQTVTFHPRWRFELVSHQTQTSVEAA